MLLIIHFFKNVNHGVFKILVICDVALHLSVCLECLHWTVNDLHEFVDDCHNDVVVVTVFSVLENYFVAVQKIVGQIV